MNLEPLGASCTIFLDRPHEEGDYEYAVTALDTHGWESPRSHRALATCGLGHPVPRIIASKPYTRLAPGEELPVRVVVISDLELARVKVFFRRVDEEEWQDAPLLHSFRCSYVGTIPGGTAGPVPLEYYVLAEDA